MLKKFAVHLQDQRDYNFQASHSEIPAGVFWFFFFSKKSPAFILSLNSSQSRVPAKSIDVLKLSRERRHIVFSSVGLTLCWICSSYRNDALIHMEKLFIASYGFSVEVTGLPFFFQPFNLKLQCQNHFVLGINLEMWKAWKFKKKKNLSSIYMCLSPMFPTRKAVYHHGILKTAEVMVSLSSLRLLIPTSWWRHRQITTIALF